MAKRKDTKGQTAICKTLRRISKIEQHEPHWKLMLNSCLPEGKAVPAPLEAPVKYVKYLCCVQMYQNGERKTYSFEKPDLSRRFRPWREVPVCCIRVQCILQSSPANDVRFFRFNFYCMICLYLSYPAVVLFKQPNCIMKRTFKQRWSSMPQNQQKGTITSHFKWTHWTEKRQRHISLEIKILTWDRHTNVAGLNLIMRLQPFPLDWCFFGYLLSLPNKV
jgi:hypothetical protein